MKQKKIETDLLDPEGYMAGRWVGYTRSKDWEGAPAFPIAAIIAGQES